MESRYRGAHVEGSAGHSQVRDLSRFGSADIATAGGKGARLGDLTRAGLPVPRGFVITADAYRDASARLGLGEEVSALVDAAAHEDAASVVRRLGRIRATLQSAPLPPALEAAVLAAYRGMGGGAVAVRSSATAEDLAEAAFAGQQETYLNVVGEQPLVQAVRDCWASLWSDRAVTYRGRQQVDPNSVAIAVVVQQMAAAAAAGVMFTAAPVSGSRDSVLVDANPGLGEAVVAGLVTPERFVVRKRGLRVTSYRPGGREVVIRSREGGGTEVVRDEGDGAPSLPPRAVRKLAAMGVAIERAFGAPQDIEWAWERDGRGPGRLLILQARPMTAVPKAVSLDGPMRSIVPMLLEMWPTRPFPLDMTTFTGAIEESIGRLLRSFLGAGAPDPTQALVEEDGVVVRVEIPAARPSPAVVGAVVRTLWRTRRFDPSSWQADPILAEAWASARELAHRDPAALSWAENLVAVRDGLDLVARVMALRERYAPRALFRLAGLWLRLALAGKRGLLGILVGGVETRTSQTNRGLEELAGAVRADQVLRDCFSGGPASGLMAALQATPSAAAFLGQLERFLGEFGHREVSLAVSQGTWGDHPEVVLGILKSLAATPPRQEVSLPAWQAAREDILRSSLLGHFPLRAGFLRALEGSRRLMQIREDTHFFATLAMPSIRRSLLELGRRLQAAGVLQSAEQVFHLRREELEEIAEPASLAADARAKLRDLVAARMEKRRSLEAVPMFDPSLLEAVRRRSGEQGVLLAGSPGSPGVARGPVRVIRSETEFESLRDGDVLVAPFTNPSWTPLFTRASAVVVDRGGASSHAAIVAREYGVPAVMGTVDGTQRLSDGQVVRVDGTRGLVFKEDPS